MFVASKTASVSGTYEISRSLRFNSADTAYLNRTPASAGNRKTWTYSTWLKRSSLGSYQCVLGYVETGGLVQHVLQFTDTDELVLYIYVAGYLMLLKTTQVFRDVSAWYHIVITQDTTQATSTNRAKMYVNGTQVTSFATANYPAQNTDGYFNSNVPQGIGSYPPTLGTYFNGYITETYMVDGQALTPSSFGETNAQTGVWQPKAYSGSYGTNGFYLNFSDNSNTTAATLGKDYSGNGNNWTPNNFSVTAGAGNDSLVDSPTSYGVDTGAGGTVRGNYCTFNPLAKGSTNTIANGNLDAANTTSGGAGKILGTIGITSGKWYAEATMSGGGGMPGIAEVTCSLSGYPGAESNSWGYNNGGDKYNGGSNYSYGASFTTNDVIGLALDMDAGTITFYKNNTSQGVAFSSGIAGKTITFVARGDTTTTESWNFGQRPFAYTAPSGFKALCTQNLPTPTIGATTATLANKYFDVVLRNGGGSSGGTYSTTVNMANGALLWDKPRNQASSNYLMDSVRGISKLLTSNGTSGEATDTAWFTNFGTNSYTTGATDWGTGVTIVDWIWAANGSGSTNTAGSITSTVSANTTSGFSVVTMTYASVAGTVGHGLGVAPQMIIVKSRGGTGNWFVSHTGLTNMSGYYILLDSTSAEGAANWGGSPTSTTFNMSNNLFGSDTYVAYCFAPIAGYSAFGSYTGNGSADGPFVFTGMRPAYIMLKRTDNTSDWFVYDATRSPYNAASTRLYPDLSVAEDTGGSNYDIDFLSNGFKLRGTGQINISGSTWIFMAFASNPFKYSLAR